MRQGAGCLSRVLALTHSQQPVRRVCPLYILTGQSKVIVQHRQRAMAHQQLQTISTFIISPFRDVNAASFEIPCRQGRLPQETKGPRLDDRNGGL